GDVSDGGATAGSANPLGRPRARARVARPDVNLSNLVYRSGLAAPRANVGAFIEQSRNANQTGFGGRRRCGPISSAGSDPSRNRRRTADAQPRNSPDRLEGRGVGLGVAAHLRVHAVRDLGPRVGPTVA